MNDIEIVECDFSIPLHRQKLIELMNTYILDKMGGGDLIKGEKIVKLIEGLQSHTSKIILFAIVNGEIVGLSNCFINFSTFSAAPFINIHDIIVDKEYRGTGIGHSLMHAIIKRANDIGCSKITLEVREDNIRAQKLYSSLEFEDCSPKMFFWTKSL